MIERRRSNRIRATFDVRLDANKGRYRGTVSDISKNGCFILSGADLEIGELLRVEINLRFGGWVSIWGEVVNSTTEIGFAVRFTDSLDIDLVELEKLVAAGMVNSDWKRL
jgi:hypothetical protein